MPSLKSANRTFGGFGDSTHESIKSEGPDVIIARTLVFDDLWFNGVTDSDHCRAAGCTRPNLPGHCLTGRLRWYWPTESVH